MIAGPCPEGYWCGIETSVPSECPRGKYSNDTHLTDVSHRK